VTAADRSDLLLDVSDLVVEYPAGAGRRVHAVSGVSFDVARGETLGLVGESGCGKSTAGRAVLGLPPPTSGSVVFDGTDLATLSREELRRTRTRLQVIFQDPISSLNPGRRIADIIAEPLSVWGRDRAKADRHARVQEMMGAVGIDPETYARRRAYELSGGQCQRVSIARALMLQPELVVCDEPVSSLDVSVQAQILNLLETMKARHGLTMIFISHDLSVIRHVADRIAVMYLGKLCEVGGRSHLFTQPRHPYTAALLASVPVADPTQPVPTPPVGGELPSAITPPTGCRFHTRCPRADAQCTNEEPLMRSVGEDHGVACHHPIPVGVSITDRPERPERAERPKQPEEAKSSEEAKRSERNGES
jgi:peptide/nickel transport system ATP-binding protein